MPDAFNAWFYAHPTWMVAIVVCIVVVGLPLIGLYFWHKNTNWLAREHDTSMTGLSYALAGGVYAVVLAFVAVAAYETADRAAGVASAEANALNSLTFASAGLPSELGLQIRTEVDGYIKVVTDKEWPAQQAYQIQDATFENGWAKVRELSRKISAFEPANPGQETVKASMVHVMTDLASDRRARILASGEHLPDPVWQMLVVGLVIVMFFVYLFGPHSFKLHIAVVGMTMLSIGLVFTLIIALDYPFRGDLSVSDEAFVGVREVGDRAFGVGEKPGAEGAEKPGERKADGEKKPDGAKPAGEKAPAPAGAEK
jgi:hypothetical protein